MRYGDSHTDDPIYAEPKETPLEAAVGRALNPHWQPKPSLIVGHERVMLKWVKPEAPQ
jgi:hypothetical protein